MSHQIFVQLLSDQHDKRKHIFVSARVFKHKLKSIFLLAEKLKGDNST